ncbi:MAG TPA: Nramp family divalent metal transporter, partial [Candidatus Glassbacteria bacterium]|nr:Nramp family divalent metal transporter [Candidatus Glassbacteria bacterium]
MTAQPSLPEVHGSVQIHKNSRFWRRLFTFSGPAFMVSVGYMDPGNWATDLAAGSQFGYRLIFVVLLSNIMAILFQTLSARMGIVMGRDLAQACRDHYPPWITWIQWIICEIAIAACDLAEVIGSAIALKLLFGIPLMWGVLITAFDVIILLLLQSYGIRKMEALILTLVFTIGVCFTLEMFLSRPDLGGIVQGFKPMALHGSSLYIAIGIIGATVMPHNLYLHSALVQSRAIKRDEPGQKEAARFNLIDSVVALNAAFFVNAAILVLAAAAFYRSGHHEVASIEHAHSLLEPLLGSTIAPLAFAVALLASGQSSTLTGTLAGQIVMEGFINIRLRPWLRRLVTRSLAIIPATIVIYKQGESSVDALLVLSQVILSLQLSFAIVPLIHFTSDRRKMGRMATPLWGRIFAWLAAAVILALNLQLVFGTLSGGLSEGRWAVKYLLLPACIFLIPMLAWIIIEPLVHWRPVKELLPLPQLPEPVRERQLGDQFNRIGIALEAVRGDRDILSGMIPLARATGAEIVLMHVVESATARFIGRAVNDEEAKRDLDYLESVRKQLENSGITCRLRIGAGEPEVEIARMAEEEKIDLIVVGSHGHRLLGDLFHGATINELRHKTSI